MLSLIADICGIISCIISLVLWFKFDRIRYEISLQKEDYSEEQRNIYIQLSALRDNIIKDGIFGLRVKCELRTQLLSYLVKFKHILSLKDKLHIYQIIRCLNYETNKINVERLCFHLDYTIARFTKKEVHK